jgi:Flp pilus assembly protein TadB
MTSDEKKRHHKSRSQKISNPHTLQRDQRLRRKEQQKLNERRDRQVAQANKRLEALQSSIDHSPEAQRAQQTRSRLFGSVMGFLLSLSFAFMFTVCVLFYRTNLFLRICLAISGVAMAVCLVLGLIFGFQYIHAKHELRDLTERVFPGE